MFQFHFFRRQMIACLALMLLPGVSLWAAEGWQAGVAKVKVTPTVAMPMAGYGSRGNDHSEGTLNDLWVKALVLQDAEGHRGLLVTMDLCGIGRDLSQTLRQQIGQRLNLKPNEILFSTSHTHSGPVVGKYLKPLHFLQLNAADQQLVNEYEEQLAKKVVDCAAEAAAALKPSRLSHGSGHVTFATNRRNNPAGDVLNRRAAGTIVGPADYSVPVLAIHQQDKLVATIFGYACHCTVLSGMQFSGDYAGFAQEALEAAHPDCTAMFWAGCGADQNPLPRGTTDFAEQYGQDLADGVQRVLDGVLRPIEPELTAKMQEVDLALDTLPSTEQLEKDATSDNKYTAARAKMLLEQIRAGKPLSSTYPYPIASWKLGKSVNLVALGGEVVVDYALAIKAESDDPQSTWVMGYANDVMAYIPSRRVLAEGGYEGGGAMVYYGLPTVWAPVIERTILDEVERQLSH